MCRKKVLAVETASDTIQTLPAFLRRGKQMTDREQKTQTTSNTGDNDKAGPLTESPKPNAPEPQPITRDKQ